MTSDQSTLSELYESKNPKITRDPVTGYAMVELLNQQIVLKKGTRADEVFSKPLQDVVECAL